VRRIYRAANRQHFRVIDEAAAFAPHSAGSPAVKARMTLQAVRQTFPLLAELVAAAGNPPFTECDAEAFGSANDELKALLDRHGSDKASTHNYHLIYGRVLDSGTRAILEVGLGTNNEDVMSNMGRDGRPGASLRAFRDYLPRAHIYGADVDRRILFADDRITTFYVDQTDAGSVEALCGQLPELDLVIDDGLHAPNANIAILTLAVKRLRPGGWVVIEDIADAAVPVWRVVGSLLPGWERFLIHADGGVVFAARK
jgi:hypothetical protein